MNTDKESKSVPLEGDQTIPYEVGTSQCTGKLPQLPGYEVQEELGRGGMGIVYKARQLSLNRIVALKMVREGIDDDDCLVRFKAEAEAVAQLQHPHIVQIYEIGAHDGRPYFSLEFMAGGSLAAKAASQPQPARQAAELVETIARAVHAVHQKGIIHRDLKPQNVLLTADGVPKVSDFGLAKRLEGTEHLTQTGAVVGTPAYMAPEQAAGDTDAVTPAIDVYALGVILYELLTGWPPFRSSTPIDVLRKVIQEEPVPPRQLQPRLHRDLETVCLKALAKELTRRYATALELAEDLERFNAGEPIRARREGVAGRVWRKVKRRPMAWLGGATSLLAVLVAGLFFLLGHDSQQRAKIDVRVSTLLRDYDACLDRMDWSEANLLEAETLLDELETVEPKRVSGTRALLHLRLEEHLKAQFKLARLEPVDVRRIEEQLRLLEHRKPEVIADLQSKLRKRLRDWETVFELRAPFDNLNAVFGGMQFTTEGSLLRMKPLHRPADGKRASYSVLTQQQCQGNVKLEAVLKGNLDDVTEVGLLLNVGQTHTQRMTAVCFSPDGRQLASAGQDGKVLLWDTSTGHLQRSLIAPGGPVRSIAFHPTGQGLAAAVGDRVVLWEPGTGKERTSWRAHEGLVHTLAWSRDGGLLATGGADRSVKLWDGSKYSLQKTLPDHPAAVDLVSFGVGDTLVAVAEGKDRVVRRWDLGSGEHQQFVATYPYADNRVAVSPDGKHFAGTSWGPSLSLWDVAVGKPLPVPSHAFATLAFSPAGDILTIGYLVIALRDVRSGALLKSLPGHAKPLVALSWSPDGQTLASASEDGTIKLWDVPSATQRLVLGGQSYTFVLSTANADPTGPDRRPSLGEMLRAGGKAVVQIMRDGAQQRSQQVSIPKGLGELRLLASRVEDLLTLQVNDQSPLEFRDLFSFQGAGMGVFGLQANGDLRLTELRGWRQAAPPTRSPLEEGDELFQGGKFHEALGFYQQQALVGGLVGAEARCKQALCLARVRRPDEAERLLQGMVADRDAGRWSLVAACQLWMHLLGKRQFDEVDLDALYEHLRNRSAQLSGVVPDEITNSIQNAYGINAVDYLFMKEPLLRRLQRAVQASELFRQPWQSSLMPRLQVMQGHWLLGRPEEARQVARGILAHLRDQPLDRSWQAALALGEACWLLRRHDDPKRLQEDMTGLVEDRTSSGVDPFFVRPLKVEQARLYIALGQRAEAEALLQRYLKLTPPNLQEREYQSWSSACLMLGFMAEDRGAKEEALKWWRQGLYHTWLRNQPRDFQERTLHIRDVNITHHLILASLTNELSDQEGQELARKLIAQAATNSPLQDLSRSFPVSGNVLREMWRTPRGRALGRKIAFRDLELEELVRGPVYLHDYEFCRQGALPTPSTEQDAILWQLQRGFMDAFGNGKLVGGQLLALGLAWKTGLTGPLGWDGAAAKLEPELRAPLGYIVAHRLMRLGKQVEAERLFRGVLTDAPASTVVHQLAKNDLAHLPKK